MLEYQLLLLFAACAATVFISGFVIVKFYRGAERQPDPVIVIPLTPETENLEFIVRGCVYPAAESCPEAFVLAVDFGAGTDIICVFEKLMKRSCPYKIIGAEELSDFSMRGKSL